MPSDDQRMSRRSFLKRTAAVSAGTIGARGIYELLDTLAGPGPQRVEAATSTRPQEQYLIQNLQAITDNGVSVVIPPLHADVITARLAPGRTWNATTLKSAQTRLENALQTLETAYPPTAAGLTIVVGWGLPYFQTYVSKPWSTYQPMDTESNQPAMLDAIRFPSDPSDLTLEDNHVVFKIRSDSQNTLTQVAAALFTNSTSKAFIGSLFDITSIRHGFLGRGFGTTSIAKGLAQAAGVANWEQIPDNAQLMMGFTSTQQAANGPGNIVNFETLGLTNQSPSSYFAHGCTMHLSHLYEDLSLWYGGSNTSYPSRSYGERVARMFSPHTKVPADGTVTLSNGPDDVSTLGQIKQDAANGLLGHTAPLQLVTRLKTDTTDIYGQFRPAGTPIPIREDFNTLDDPFYSSGSPANKPGLHFVVFVPTSNRFHKTRLAMDGLVPDGNGGTIDLRADYNLTPAQVGIQTMTQSTHRQNFLVPPRAHRSFPLAELLR